MGNFESIKWSPVAHVDKYEQDVTEWVANRLGILTPSGDDFMRLGIQPDDTAESVGNLLTTAGLTRLTSLLIGAGGQALTPTSTPVRLGVGNGAGTAAVGDTDMSASPHTSANQWYQVMDSTYPSVSAGVVTFKASFATGDGNFAWNEWGIDVHTSAASSGATVNGLLFNHKTSAALGTKASGTWALTVTVTFS
jgi:hypothetical protein